MSKEFLNADYYLFEGEPIDFNELKELEPDQLNFVHGVYSHLLLSDANGIYIPKRFYENFDFEKWNLSKEEYQDLENEHCEHYWDLWNELLKEAKFIDNDKNEWILDQDGHLFAIHLVEYDGEEIS